MFILKSIKSEGKNILLVLYEAQIPCNRHRDKYIAEYTGNGPIRQRRQKPEQDFERAPAGAPRDLADGGAGRLRCGTLLQRPALQPLGAVAPDDTGRFTVSAKALASSDFRLDGGIVAGAPVAGALITVPVVPKATAA